MMAGSGQVGTTVCGRVLQQGVMTQGGDRWMLIHDLTKAVKAPA